MSSLSVSVFSLTNSAQIRSTRSICLASYILRIIINYLAGFFNIIVNSLAQQQDLLSVQNVQNYYKQPAFISTPMVAGPGMQIFQHPFQARGGEKFPPKTLLIGHFFGNIFEGCEKLSHF